MQKLNKTAIHILLVFSFLASARYCFADLLYLIGIGPSSFSYWNSEKLENYTSANSSSHVSLCVRGNIGATFRNIPLYFDNHLSFSEPNENVLLSSLHGIGSEIKFPILEKRLSLAGSLGLSLWTYLYGPSVSSTITAIGPGALLSLNYSLLKDIGVSLDLVYGVPIKQEQIPKVSEGFDSRPVPSTYATLTTFHQNLNVSLKLNFQKK